MELYRKVNEMPRAEDSLLPSFFQNKTRRFLLLWTEASSVGTVHPADPPCSTVHAGRVFFFLRKFMLVDGSVH